MNGQYATVGLFAVLAVAALWAFARTPGASEPVKVYEPNHAAPEGVKALFAGLTLVMALIVAGALGGAGSLDTNTFASVRASGGDSAVTMAGGVIVVGLLALIALVSGVLRKLALIVFLGAVLLSVAMAGGG